MTTQSDLIIAIDGPAGAGKSTIARGVASQLGFQYLDTGAIYRTYTLAAMRGGIDLEAPDLSETEVFSNVLNADIEMIWDEDPNRPAVVTLDGEDVSEEIRTNNVTSKIRYVADMSQVRELSTALQREAAKDGRFVCEGRDQGTVVFPNAFLKIYLWATPQERASRRFKEVEGTSEAVDMVTLTQRIMGRDRLDMGREIGALKKAFDAIELDSSDLSIDETIAEVVRLAQEKLAEG